MPNPHFSIKITQRSKRQSAVAGAAYQSGENLFSEYDQKMKRYSDKRGILYTEIMLPANAPPEYADREKLWNSVETVEKQWNAQLARRFVLALPVEVPAELHAQMVRDYCMEHFVSKGMCCDIAIHDTGRGNPHCHVMLTMRAMDDKGKWLPKSRKVYDIDENGERIRLPSGNYKSHKESTVDWNEQYHGEQWRHGWEEVQNKYLEMVGSPERVDLRSYEKQGIDKIPTVHMGAAVTQMERRGMETNVGNLNRDIKKANRLMAVIRNTIQNLTKWIAGLNEKREEALAESEPKSPSVAKLLQDYLTIRKAERGEWSRYGQQKGSLNDLKAVAGATVYLQQHKIVTLDDLAEAIKNHSSRAWEVRKKMRSAESRMKTINAIEKSVAECKEHGAVHDRYVKIGWKIRKDIFAETHKEELSAYNKAYRYLKKQGVEPDVDMKFLKAEYKELDNSYGELTAELQAIQEEMKPLKDVQFWVDKVLEPEKQVEGKEPKQRVSVRQKLKEFEAKKAEIQRNEQTQQQKRKQYDIEH